MLTSYQEKKKKPGIHNAKYKLKKLRTNERECTTSKEREKIFGGTHWEWKSNRVEGSQRRGQKDSYSYYESRSCNVTVLVGFFFNSSFFFFFSFSNLIFLKVLIKLEFYSVNLIFFPLAVNLIVTHRMPKIIQKFKENWKYMFFIYKLHF